MWRPGTVIGEALREVSLRVPWLRRGVSFRTPGEWIGQALPSRLPGEDTGSFVRVRHWLCSPFMGFSGEGCGVSFLGLGYPG